MYRAAGLYGLIIGPLSARSCARLYGSAAAAQCAGDRAAAAILGGAWWTWLAVTGVAGLVGVSVRALSVRHEALLVRAEVRDRRRFTVVAVG